MVNAWNSQVHIISGNIFWNSNKIKHNINNKKAIKFKIKYTDLKGR